MTNQNQNYARPSGQDAAGSAYEKACAAVRRHPTPKILLEKAGTNVWNEGILPGQVWGTHPVPTYPSGLPEACRTDDPFLVVVLEVRDAPQRSYQVLTVAPILVEVEMVGPEDVVLPRSILGFEAAVTVGSAIGMLAGNLADCRGTLPSGWIGKFLGFRRYLQDIAKAPPSGLQVGSEYLDEDLRYQLHENLVDRLEYLQQPYVAFLQRKTACQPCGQDAGGYDMCPICGGQTYEV